MSADYVAEVHRHHEEIVAEWMKDHRARLCELSGGDCAVKVVRLARPGTSWYSIDYVLYGGTLCVCGDLNDAVYRWKTPITLEYLAGLTLDSFGEKCLASPHHPLGKRWEPNLARGWIEAQVAQVVALESMGPWSYMECVERLSNDHSVGLEEAVACPESWAELLHERSEGIVFEERGREIPLFTEPSEDWKVGYTWDVHTRAHWRGLQLAHQQLSEGDYGLSRGKDRVADRGRRGLLERACARWFRA